MSIRRKMRPLLALPAVLVLVAGAADAKCTRLAFSVNDYGKDGPTNDAKKLLDVYIAKWAAENGIKKYTTGKKDVKCELFLDFGVFDEHTCRAEASVCWESGGAIAKTAPAKAAPGGSAAVNAPSSPTASAPAASPPATTKPAPKAPAAKPAEPLPAAPSAAKQG